MEGPIRFELIPQGFAVPRISHFATAPSTYIVLAALRGFEPQLPESEAGVLPLDERAMVPPSGIEPL